MGELAEKIWAITGENVYMCYFCGKCGASCPMAEFMDYKPYQIIHMLQTDDEDALKAKSIWFCASCFSCSIRCPRKLDIAKIMEGVRLLVLRAGTQMLKLRSVEELSKYPPIALVAASRKYIG